MTKDNAPPSSKRMGSKPLTKLSNAKLALRRLVLVVDDMPSERKRMQAWLSEEGYLVKTASEYESALKEMEKQMPDLACIDLTLPRESGLDLVETIRMRWGKRAVPIIVMSERHSPEHMADAERAGANAFLKKPFTGPTLLKYVRFILEGPNASRPSVRRLQPVDDD